VRKLALSFAVVALFAGMARAARFDEEHALEFIALCRNAPGRQPNLSQLYWKLKVFEAAHRPFDATAYADYVRSLQNEDGGFGLWPKDVSSAEATLYALTVLRQAGADAADAAACERFLRACLAQKAAAAERYCDLAILRDLHACLMALATLGCEVPDLERYLELFDQDRQAWGLYYRVSVSRAFGHPVEDVEGKIAHVDALVTDRALRRLWPQTELHYALEAMELLGGRLSHEYWLRARTRTAFERRGRGPGRDLIEGWREVRLAQLLGKETPGLDEWLDGLGSLAPRPVGGYAPMPGMETHERATFMAWRLLGPDAAGAGAGELADRWKDKQQPDGYYESSPPRASYWFFEPNMLERRIRETAAALTAMRLAGVGPTDRAGLVGWLNAVLAEDLDELDIGQVRQVLECFELLGERPRNAPELLARLQERFGNDVSFMVRAARAAGVRPRVAGGAGAVRALLDRVRERGVPLPASMLADAVETLDGLGESYAGAGDLLKLFGSLQNPDGGVPSPGDPHSNIFETIAAVRAVRALRAWAAPGDAGAAAP